jgi:hypothetical protein
MSEKTKVEFLVRFDEIPGELKTTNSQDLIVSNAITVSNRMEKAETSKFYNFLEMEKKIGISDLKTIERIQWYYITYFNETSNTKENEQTNGG